jgi:hypothetical protein
MWKSSLRSERCRVVFRKHIPSADLLFIAQESWASVEPAEHGEAEMRGEGTELGLH